MSFQYFSQLPCELRLEIWSYALASEAPAGHECGNYPSPLFTTNREARRESQSHYSIRIEIIDLEKAEKIVETWCPKIPGETVWGEGYWHKCCQLLEHMPRQLQALVIGCIYLSKMRVYDLDLRGWFFRRTGTELVEFSRKKYTLHSTAQFSPTYLRELKSTMDLHLRRQYRLFIMLLNMRMMEQLLSFRRSLPLGRDWSRSRSERPWDPENPILTERALAYLDEDLARWQATIRESKSAEQEHNIVDGDGKGRLIPSGAKSRRKRRDMPSRKESR
ncbi:hypothetical protein PG993_009805 [Apiospora rasikravindrae]|uniref:2EXR domain-containing protein n=1 Tax=Apiospora rasikravindrae TaxID=990691 RepID=A0ABR1SKE8_9PEZI